MKERERLHGHRLEMKKQYLEMEGDDKKRTLPRILETNQGAGGCCAAELCPETEQMRELK